MSKFLCFLLSLASLPAFGSEIEQQPLSPEEINAAEEVGISQDELYQVSNPMTREAREEVERDIERTAQDLDALSQKTDKALGLMVRRAAWVLQKKGFDVEAAEMQAEYNQFYTNAVYFYYKDIVPVELGDHAPISQKLADWYDMIEEKLKCNTAPVNLCKVFHLIDIKILNYGLPVTFKPKATEQWCLETTGVTCKEEYKLHFAGKPLGGIQFEYFGVVPVVGYWVSWGVCVGATFGAGAIGLICSPIATVVEIGTGKYIAPPLSDWVFDRVNEE